MLAFVNDQGASSVFDKVVTLPDMSLAGGEGLREETVLDRPALKALRERAKLTTRELAEEAGLSSSTVNTLELLPVAAMADTLLTVIKVFSKKLSTAPQNILDELL
jgi:DNA-binding XRE family transcriptional regulator